LLTHEVNFLKIILQEIKEEYGIEIQATVQNIFCFDNESFRLLAAHHNNAHFENEDDYKKSWETSVLKSEEMLNYIINLPVYNVQDSVSISDARKIILQLAKPIAEVTRNIQVNIKLADDKQKEINNTEITLKDLEKDLYIEQQDLETEILDKPRTVCTSNKCIEVIKFNGNNKYNYKTHCHSECHLEGVATDCINTAALLQCSAMQNGICQKCGCSWNMHMHITYNINPVLKKIVDENMAIQLSYKKSVKEKLEIINAVITSKIEKLRNEENVIIEISAKFAFFIKTNAIVPFNDAIEDYLNLCIQEEQTKQKFNNEDSTILKSLLGEV
jgi:hypothetical protein